jgi:hypothetical protein
MMEVPLLLVHLENGTGTWPAAPLVVRCRYLIVVPRPLPAAALVVQRKAVFIYRGAQAVARGGARCASKVLDRCARPLPAAPYRYLGVVPRPLSAAAPVVRRGYLIVMSWPMPAAPLVVFRRYLIVAPKENKNAAVTLSQQEMNNSAELLRENQIFTRL